MIPPLVRISGGPFTLSLMPYVNRISTIETGHDGTARRRRNPKFLEHFCRRLAHSVGLDGDRNRMLNSDPVLWRFAGDLRGLKVLDVGCGTGYLSKHASARGAMVTGVDLSERMI